MNTEFDRLKAWRKEVAEDVGPQVFKWLSNDVLRAIAEAEPQTVDDLLEIKGLGPSSVEKYGGDILKALTGEDLDMAIGGKSKPWEEDTPFPLPVELRPFVTDSDRFFNPINQRKYAEERKAEAERPRTLEEDLKKELTFKDGFQIGPLMRRAICEIKPRTIADLEAMDFQHTDMNPIVIERYGRLILSIVSRHDTPHILSMSTDRPTMITSAFDLLILREKRRENRPDNREEMCPDFSVCGRTATFESRKYELVLEYTLSFIDSCLYLEDAEGKPLSAWAIAQRLRSIGVPLPSGYEYLSPGEDAPSYWQDAENYRHLIVLKHRPRSEE